MDINNILSASWLDILFDNRNKEYGAYALRKTYDKRIRLAILGTTLFVISAIAAVYLTGSGTNSMIRPEKNEGFVIKTYIEKPLIEKPPEPKPKPAALAIKPPVKTEIFTDPLILDEKNITKPVPTQAGLDEAAIGLSKTDGPAFTGEEQSGALKGDPMGIAVIKTTEPEKTLLVVEVPAKYNGDWIKFLLKHLDPEIPVYNRAPAGQYTVIIQFVVDKEGNVSDIKPLTHIGYGMEEEAMRVLKKATKWKPAMQNGYKVKAFRQQLVTFRVLNES